MINIKEDIELSPKLLIKLERDLKYKQIGRDIYKKELKKLRVKFAKAKKADKKFMIRKYIDQLRDVCEERDKNINA